MSEAVIAPGPAGKVAPSGPFSRHFLGFAIAMSFSALGDSAWYIALTWTLIQHASPGRTGLLLAVAGLPRLIMLLGGGVIADRYGAKRLMVLADLLRCLVMLLAAVLIALAGPSLSVLFVAALLLALFSAFFIPASGAVRPLLLEDRDLVRGNAVFSFGSSGGQALGSPIGAGLIALAGVPLVALVNAASFAVSAVAAWRVRYVRQPASQPVQRPPVLRSFGDGFRYLRTQRRLALVVLVVGLTELSCAPPVNVGLVLLAPKLHQAAGGAGLLLTGYTVGAIGSLVLTMVWPPKRRSGASLVLGTLLAGLTVASIGFLHSLPIALLMYLVLGISTGQLGVVLMSMLQRWCDRAVTGRVMAVVSIVSFGSVPVANLLTGWLVSSIGIGTTMLAFGLLSVAGSAVALAHPQLRQARLD